MIRDGKMSSEIRRKRSFKGITGMAETEHALEGFTLVDGSGRIQVPREFLNRLGIKERVRLNFEENRVSLEPEEQED